MPRSTALMLLCSMALAVACDRGPKRVAAASPPSGGNVMLAGATQRPASEADQELSDSIRRAIAEEGSLSATAQSVTVASVDGVVTLRGRVDSAAEKDTIATIARRTPGVRRVDDQVGVVLR